MNNSGPFEVVSPTLSGIRTPEKDLPQPINQLSNDERAIWNHVVASLAEHGLVHKTDSLMLHVICASYTRWVYAEKVVNDKIVQDGTIMTATPNGYEVPHPMFYAAEKLKKELLKWLPEACLTIPAFIKATKGDDPKDKQLDNADPLKSHIGNKPRLVK